MSDAYVQVAPDDTTGKKIQTYENTVGLNDVHAQAVVLVDSAGVPYTPLTSLDSANIARFDPSGNNSTGIVGDLSKPFLTIQGAINALQAGSFTTPIIDIGNNFVTETVTTSLTSLQFIGSGQPNVNLLDITFTETTNTVSAYFSGVNACQDGIVNIEADTNGICEVYAVNSWFRNITNTTGSLVLTAFGDSGVKGTVHAGSGKALHLDGWYVIATVDSPGSIVTATGLTKIDTLTAAASIELDDARIGTNNAGITPVYFDTILKGIGEGGTTGQIQAKASNADFDVAWVNRLTPNAAGIAGKILRSDGSNYIDSLATYPTASGSNGNVMTSDGTNWISIPIPATGGSVPTNRLLTIGGTAQDLSANRTWLAPGIVGRILRSDGANYINSLPAFPNSGTVAGKVIIADGTNYVESTPTFPNASAASGKFIRSDGTNWIASTPTLPTSAGVAGKILRSDATNYIDTTATFPTTAGTNGNVLTSDGTNWASIAIPVLPTLLATNADAPASTINIAPVAGTNLVSKALTIAAGDQIRVEIDGTIVNNSTVNRTYTITCSIGGAGGLNVSLVDTAVIPASATNRLVRSIAATFGIKSSSSAWLVGRAVDYGGAALGAGSLLTASRSVGGSQQSSSNFTGLQTINITMGSNAAVPTQSFELTAYTIRQIATNP